jgi:hypothetical protein
MRVIRPTVPLSRSARTDMWPSTIRRLPILLFERTLAVVVDARIYVSAHHGCRRANWPRIAPKRGSAYPHGRERHGLIAIRFRGAAQWRIPARKSVATSKAFLDQSDVNWQVFLDAIPHDGVQPVTDVWPDMDSAIDKMLTPMWNNQITVNDFVTRLNPVIQALLDKAKVRRDLSGSYLPVGWKIPSV